MAWRPPFTSHRPAVQPAAGMLIGVGLWVTVRTRRALRPASSSVRVAGPLFALAPSYPCDESRTLAFGKVTVASEERLERAKRVVEGLRQVYPDATCALNFE